MKLHPNKLKYFNKHGYLILRNVIDKKKIFILEKNVIDILSLELKKLNINIEKKEIIQKGFPFLKKIIQKLLQKYIDLLTEVIFFQNLFMIKKLLI